MTALDTDLIEEVTGSLAGCLGTIQLAMAVTEDPAALHALEAVAMVITTSHEHLSRVDAMVFPQAGDEPVDKGPQVMGQDEPGECLHLDLDGPYMGGVLVCRDCAATIGGPHE